MRLTEELVAERDVRAVLARYCRGIDRMDAELTVSCWHDDGIADYGGMYRGSPRGFVEWLWPIHARMVGHVHTLGQAVVEVVGDEAVSEAYVGVVLRLSADDGRLWDLVGRGRYLDRFSCRDGRWAIDHRRFVSDLGSIQEVGAGPANLGVPVPPAEAGLVPLVARRDREDPSYELFAALGATSPRVG